MATVVRQPAFPVFAAALLIILTANLSFAQRGRSISLIDNFNQSHQSGARLGAWVDKSSGDPQSPTGTQTSFYKRDFSSGSFYLEGYFAYRVNPQLMVEISGGVVSRGDVNFRDTLLNVSEFGTLQIYPILLKLKLYPLASLTGRFQPYVSVGGGLYYGRQSIQLTNNPFFTSFRQPESATDFNYVIGGGFDIPVASVVALDFSAQYMPVQFDDGLVDLRDYRALTVTIGAKYLMHKNKKSKKRQRKFR